MGARAFRGQRPQFGPDRRASMSVEMALVTTFFLVPLLLLGLDFMFLVLGRQQLAEASHAVMMLAWSSPASALDQTALDATLATTSQGGVGTITLTASPEESFACLQSDGSDVGSSGNGCTSGIAETFVSYRLAVTIALPIGLGLVPNPYVISADPTVRIR